MHQIKLISKLGLTLITITAISVAVAIQASYYNYYYSTQAADAQPPPEAPRLPDNIVLPNDIVRSGTIIDGEVQTQDLARDAVRSDNIADGEVQPQDLASGAPLPNVFSVSGNAVNLDPHDSGSAVAQCPPGTILIGGGYRASPFVNVYANAPSAFPYDQSEWLVLVNNEQDVARSVIAIAVCMGPSP